MSHAGIVPKQINVGTCKQHHDYSFLTRKFVGGRLPFPLKSAHKVTHTPFKQHNFHQYLLIAQPWELVKEVQLALIGSGSRAFQRAMDEPCTLPLSPQRVAQYTILLFFPVNFNFCRKKSATKFLCVKNFQQQSCSYNYLYSYVTVHRRIAGDIPIYLKLALKATPSENADFDRMISVNNASEQYIRAIAKRFNRGITNRKSTMRFPSTHRWTLCLIPKSPKGWPKTRLFYILRCLSYLRRN